jgi:hypothetical protein
VRKAGNIRYPKSINPVCQTGYSGFSCTDTKT